mmetsp:Transcript_26903/g.12592  ORF Transcript_26903/g.12592 Transcript_26903/m.12592 type:complete len:119 (+) Transcript_26903:107-463(+)
MTMRRTAAGLFCLLMIFSFQIVSFAGPTEEIAFLLNFIEQTECIFIRNGKLYDSLAARQHIEKKYNYYKKEITTAEDFIRYSAEKSSITGKPYKVLCNGVSMDSSDWLNTELDRMRAK